MQKYYSKSLDFPYTGAITYINPGSSFSCMFGDSAGICQNIEFLDVFTPTSWMPSQRKAQRIFQILSLEVAISARKVEYPFHQSHSSMHVYITKQFIINKHCCKTTIIQINFWDVLDILRDFLIKLKFSKASNIWIMKQWILTLYIHHGTETKIYKL